MRNKWGNGGPGCCGTGGLGLVIRGAWWYGELVIGEEGETEILREGRDALGVGG